jgi:hypothetical protein
MNRKAQMDIMPIIFMAVIVFVSIVIVLSTGPAIGNQAALLYANRSAGGLGQNQSDAVAALAPQISTLWVVVALVLALALVGALLGRGQG